MIKAEVEAIKPVWSENLLSLGQDTTIAIKRNPDGSFRAVQLSANVAPDDEQDHTDI